MMGSISLAAQDTIRTYALTEVVVTGQYEPQSLRKSVYQVRTLQSEVIRMRAATKVQDVLNTELGIRFSQDPALGASDVSLMGMSGQNVKILLDGVPLVDRGATRESLNQIDVNTIERIEIVEGPMAVIYGSDALAGVINIITRKGLESDNHLKVEATVQEESAGDEYDSFAGNGRHHENVQVAWQGGHWNATGSFTRNHFGGWRESRVTNPTLREWHPKNQWLATASAGYRSDDFQVWYRINYLDENILSKENQYEDPLSGAQMAIDREFITHRFTHQAQAEWRLNDRWSFSGAASYQPYRRRTQTTTLNLETGDRRLYLNEEGAQDESRFDTKTLRTTALHKLTDKAAIQAGLDINLNQGMGDRIDGKRSIHDYATFVSAELQPQERISIRPGLRFTYNSVYDAPPVIPSLNSRFKISDAVDLRLSYAYGFRAPSLLELYFSYHDANHDIDGNRNLKAEHSNSFAGSVMWEIRKTPAVRMVSTTGVFCNFFENMITLGNNNPDAPAHYTYLNIHRNRTAGVTLDNSFNWKNVQLSAGLSYIGVYNLFSEDDKSLPSLMWTPEFNSTITWYIDRLGASFSLFYKYNGKRSRYVETTVDNESVISLGRTSAYHWSDITATRKFGSTLLLSLGVRNLFDITDVNNTVGSGSAHSSASSITVGYGRSYFILLNFKLEK